MAELLVIAVILGLLVLLIAPSLEAARNRSRLGTCLKRLGDIASASHVYAAGDPSNFAIPVHPLFPRQEPSSPSYIGAYEWGGKSGVGRADFFPRYVGTPPLGSKYGTAAGFGPASRPLNWVMYPHGFRDHGNPLLQRIGAVVDTKLELDAFRCPADDGPPLGSEAGIGPHCPDWIRQPGQTSYDHFGTSYAANPFMIGSTSGGCLLSNSAYLRPLSRVPSPTRSILYEENIGRWAWAARREQDGCEFIGRGVDPGPTKSIRGWHGKDWTFNRAFADAHADTQRILFEGTEDSEGYFWHYRRERPGFYPPLICSGNPTDDSTQEEREQAYRCIVVRGPGWAKDTMPGDLLETGLEFGGGGRASYEDCVQSDDDR